MRTLPLIALMLTTLSIAPTFAKAGAGSSGGGNALVCFDTPEIPKLIRERDQAGEIIDGSIRNEHIKHITRLEVLDLVEAQYARGMSQPKLSDLIQPNAGEEVEDYARRIIGRLKNTAPLLHDNLMARVNEMPAVDAVAQPDGLYPVDDYNLLGRIDSTNCVVATVAVHQFAYDNLTGAPQLYFDQRLMFHAKHSALSRAVTYLHEVVYSFARSHVKHEDSQDTRKLIGLLLRKNASITELEKMINESHFNTPRFYNYYTFPMSERADRLGYIYDKLNNEAYNTIEQYVFYSNEDRAGFLEEFDAKALKELKAFVGECSGVDTCYSRLFDISRKSSIFKKEKERAQEAKDLLAKYENREKNKKDYATNKLIPLAQEKLRSLYKDKFQKDLLSVSNIPSDKLEALDDAIMDVINNKFDLFIERVRKDQVHVFKEAKSALSTISIQQKL